MLSRYAKRWSSSSSCQSSARRADRRCRQVGAGRPLHASISLQSVRGMQRRCACPIAWQPCAEHTENCVEERTRGQQRKTSKIDPKIDLKSSRIDARTFSGALRERLLALRGARSSDSGRLGATRAARRATRSDQVGRSGSLGVGRVGQVARRGPSPLAVIRIEIIIMIIVNQIQSQIQKKDNNE